MDANVFNVQREHGKDKPCLVFCSTQKSTLSGSVEFLNALIANRVELIPKNKLDENKKYSICFKDKALSNYILHGIAQHNSSLNVNDRNLIESL